jgi:hypothetical protein
MAYSWKTLCDVHGKGESCSREGKHCLCKILHFALLKEGTSQM